MRKPRKCFTTIRNRQPAGCQQPFGHSPLLPLPSHLAEGEGSLLRPPTLDTTETQALHRHCLSPERSDQPRSREIHVRLPTPALWRGAACRDSKSQSRETVCAPLQYILRDYLPQSPQVSLLSWTTSIPASLQKSPPSPHATGSKR